MTMPFWRILFGSLTNLRTYTAALSYPFRSTVWFVVRFYLLLAIVLGVTFFTAGRAVVDQFTSSFPSDAKLTLNQGVLKTEGLTLPWSTTFPLGFQVTLREQNISVQVQQEEVSLISFEDLFPEGSDSTITGEQLKDDIRQMMPVVAIAGAISVVLFVLAGRLFSAMFHTIMISWILGLFGMRIALTKLFQLTLHITVVAELASVIYLLLYRNTSFPMFEVAFLGIIFLALRSLRQPSA